jgi:hypothetical protein
VNKTPKTKLTYYERRDCFCGMTVTALPELQSLSIHLQSKHFTCVSTVHYLIPKKPYQSPIPGKLNTQNYTALWNSQQPHHPHFFPPGWLLH